MANENVETVDAVESRPGTAGEGTTTSTTETSIGLDENVASAVAYLLGFVSGIVVFLLETDNRRVRFHGAQSTVLFAGIVALSVVLGVVGTVLDVLLTGWLDLVVWLAFSAGSLALTLVAVVAWVYLVVRAYQGANPRLPVVAGIADGLVD